MRKTRTTATPPPCAAADVLAAEREAHTTQRHFADMSWSERGTAVAVEAIARLLGSEEKVRRPGEKLLLTFADDAKAAADAAGTKSRRFTDAYVAHLVAVRQRLHDALPDIRQARQLAALRADAETAVGYGDQAVTEMASMVRVHACGTLAWADGTFGDVARAKVARQVLVSLSRYESGDSTFTCWQDVLATLIDEGLRTGQRLRPSSTTCDALLHVCEARAWANVGRGCVRYLRDLEGWKPPTK